MANETTITTEQLRDIHQLVAKLRDENVGKVSLTEEEKKRFNDVLDKYEETNQKMVAEREKERQEGIITKEKFIALEKKLAEMSLIKQTNLSIDPKAYKQSLEYKALNLLVRKGEMSLYNDMETKDALRTDKGDKGGFLVPEVLVNVLLKQQEEISPVRQFARKWTMQSKSITIPVRTSIPAAPYEKELQEGPDTESSYRVETLTAFRQQANIGITQDLLHFSGFNMESEVFGDANLSFAKTEGEKYVLGTGDKEPEGFTINPDVETFDTEASGLLKLTDVIKLCARMKQTGYTPQYYFNKQTLVNLRVEEDGNNQFKWRIGGETLPSQINGFNYVILQDMVDESAGTGAKVVAFADLFAGYSIFDSVQMSIIRDDVTQKKRGLVEFAINRWNTGQVAIPEAIKLLTIKA